jgi:hypothetical protein
MPGAPLRANTQKVDGQITKQAGDFGLSDFSQRADG